MSVMPVSREELMQRLLQLGSQTDEFAVRRATETDLIVERSVVDAEYYKIFGKERLQKTYRAYLLLDEPSHQARYCEELSSTSTGAGVTPTGRAGVRAEKQFFRGKALFKKEAGKAWAWKKPEPTSFGKVYDYDFDVKRIREPIRHVVQQGGWSFVQVVRKSQATYPTTQQPMYSCPVCRGQLTWIPQYQRWYCYACREYR